jgi:uracil phosphoribosyltransferase
MIKVLQSENSLACDFLAELRDVNIQQDSLRFRKNLERLGSIFAYEISKTLKYKQEEIVTPLGVAQCNRLLNEPVLCTILRAGLPFYAGFLNFFDHAQSAFISAYRKHEKDGSFDIQLDYVSSPDLTGKTLILADPMLASGKSAELSLRYLCKNFGKPTDIHIVSIIASAEGISFLKKNIPRNATIWVVAIDQEMTAQSYIVPGLGDAGDLAFGVKGEDN